MGWFDAVSVNWDSAGLKWGNTYASGRVSLSLAAILGTSDEQRLTDGKESLGTAGRRARAEVRGERERERGKEREEEEQGGIAEEGRGERAPE